MLLEKLQQGDVNIVGIETIPDGVYDKPGDVIREGSATGHYHRLIGGVFQLFLTSTAEPDVVLARIETECLLVHEEHKTINLKPGCYRFSVANEYDHFTNRSRRVWD